MKTKSDLLEHRMKGTIKGIDKHFEIKDSDYLNIILDSSEEIELRLESIPEMITLHIKEPTKTDSEASTEITISGLNPNTTYHKYEDNYHNHVPFTTNESGKYIYNQDISESHIIFIQPRSSTYFLTEGGWVDSGGHEVSEDIATWDSDLAVRLATLEQDISNESIQIEVNNATFDGQGYTTTGSGTGDGILCSGRNNVTIKNIRITKFTQGIYFSNCDNNIIEGNVLIENNEHGMYLYNNNTNNIITNNNINNNVGDGIHLENDNINNIITDNTIINNIDDGIHLDSNSSDNIIEGNIIESNVEDGIFSRSSNNNDIINNRITLNKLNGISLLISNVNNSITNNNISQNFSSGINIGNGSRDNSNSDNRITQNCILNNQFGIFIRRYNNNNDFVNNNFFNSSTTNAYNSSINNFSSNYWEGWHGTGSYYISPRGQDDTPLSYPYDPTPPTTTISVLGTLGNNGWYISDVEVTLTAEDIHPCSSGVDETSYSFNGTDWIVYTVPFLISNEGDNTVFYYSKNNYGTVETEKTKEIKIDKNPPEIIINVPADGREYELNEPVIADWLVSDHYSGIESSLGTVPSGDYIDTSSVGEKKFIVEATNNAGHSTSQTIKYYVKTKILKRGFKLLDF